MSIADDRRSIGNELRIHKFGGRIKLGLAGITAERLAELIDPVCFVRNVYVHEAEGRTTEVLSCGHNVGFDTGDPPSFCPCCGARIIDIRIVNEEDDRDGE
jgi:hypothetical protein